MVGSIACVPGSWSSRREREGAPKSFRFSGSWTKIGPADPTGFYVFLEVVCISVTYDSPGS